MSRVGLDAEAEAHIERILSVAPPLTAEQAALVVAVFGPATADRSPGDTATGEDAA